MGIIYCAQNRINQKIYIGKTTRTLKERKEEHKHDVMRIKNSHFHNAIRKYGFSNFDWHILAKEDDDKKLCELEKHWIDILKTREKEHGYNLTDGGDGVSGLKHLTTTKEKISICQKKAWADPENRMKRIAAFQGRIISEEAKRKMSESAKKRKASEETRTKISKAIKGKNHPNYGKKFNEEFKRKLSESHKGQEPWNKGKKLEPLSREIKSKMSESHIGLKHSTGTITKMSIIAKEKWADPETREKRLEAQKKRWEKYYGRDATVCA